MTLKTLGNTTATFSVWYEKWIIQYMSPVLVHVKNCLCWQGLGWDSDSYRQLFY